MSTPGAICTKEQPINLTGRGRLYLKNENCLSKLGDIELAEFNKVHQSFSGLWVKEVGEVGRQTSEVCARWQAEDRAQRCVQGSRWLKEGHTETWHQKF